MASQTEWDDIKKSWYHKYLYEFQCDGFRLALERTILRGGTLAYVPYVNGVFSGEWLLNDCEERRRFFCRKVEPLHSRKQVETYREIAKLTRKQYNNPDFITYLPYWRHFEACKTHLIANNADITIIHDPEMTLSDPYGHLAA